MVLALLVLASIDASTALSQPSAGAGSPAAGSAAGSGSGAPEAAADDEDADAGRAAKPLVAPTDPRARVTWLRERVAAAIAAQPKLGKARITVHAVDLLTGNELVAKEADRGMSLASNAKLLTSATALATLGGGFRWRTSVFGAEPDDKGAVAGDLYVKGRGDPLLGRAELEALAAEVVARGVRSVDRLVVDASYFDDVVEPPRFDDQKLETAAFRATVAAFGVARSALTVVVVPEPSGPATVTLEPEPESYVKLVTRDVTSIAKGRTRLKVELKAKPDHLEVTVSGQIRRGEGSWEIRKRVPDPVRFAGEVFRKALIDRGVKVKSKTIARGTVPAPGPGAVKLLAVHDSAPLTEVLRHMNKLSDNYLAESVLKTIGAETRATPGPATWEDGRAAVRGYLAKLGMPPAGYRAENGSGLFDATEVSAKQMTTMLTAAYKDFRVGPDLLASLPVGGIDGTLARRWHGRAARGRVRAKTGTLDKVVTLAGYLAIDSQHAIDFAVLVNDIPPGQRGSARTAVDEIVDALIAYLGVP